MNTVEAIANEIKNAQRKADMAGIPYAVFLSEKGVIRSAPLSPANNKIKLETVNPIENN